MAISIRTIEPADIEAIKPLVRALLAETHEAGATIPPTERNVNELANLAVVAAGEGDPCLIAERIDYADKMPIGLVLWVGVSDVFERDGKPCYGLGTFVVEDERRLGVSTMLRDMASGIARRQGYTSLIGATYDDRGAAACRSNGFRVAGQLVEKPL